MGSIGGEPILPSPMIIGGIDNAVVERSINDHMASINACFESSRADNPALAGKVLVKFNIGMDGSVANPSTRSTSLRHEATEACVNAAIAKVIFPPLERGRLAVVHYPLCFQRQLPIDINRVGHQHTIGHIMCGKVCFCDNCGHARDIV